MKRTKEEARLAIEKSFEEKGVEMLSMYRSATKVMKMGCRKCGHRWEGQPREVERSNGTGCVKCFREKSRKPNEVLHECGPFLVLDLSTPSKKGKMLINKKKWEILQKEGIGRAFLCPKGYPKAKWKGKEEFVHRILMGFPQAPNQVDHINGVKHDNRMCNLRMVTALENQMNRGLRKTNKSGVIGVHEKSEGVWEASLRVNRKRVHQSLHKTIDDAAAARRKAVLEYCGEYAPKI
jgi:hypothetical protein